MSGTCPHGLETGRSSLEGVMWAGPLGFCRCHQATFGYIDSGSWWEGGSHTVTNDPDLCPACGGRAAEVLTGSGGYSFSDDGDHWLRRSWRTDDAGNVHEEVMPCDNPLW